MSAEEPAPCAGCGGEISDRYYLLAVDRRWHLGCLTCCECQLALGSELTCFAKDGSIYCRDDYYRRFSVQRCARCHLAILSSEMVMRARESVYHLSCFTCATCNEALTTGDHFGMRDDLVYCLAHFESEAGHLGRDQQPYPPPQKTKRTRTVFKRDQLCALKSYFADNPKPKPEDLKQIAEKTGLTKKVVQVWFQNARAKFQRNLWRRQRQSWGVDEAGGASADSGALVPPALRPPLTGLTDPTAAAGTPGTNDLDGHGPGSLSQTTFMNLV